MPFLFLISMKPRIRAVCNTRRERQTMKAKPEMVKNKKRSAAVIIILIAAVIVLGFICLFVGSSHMSISESFNALMGKGTAAQVRIIHNIRIPRVLAAVIAGA